MPEAQLMKGQPYSKRLLKGKLRYSYPVIVEEKRDEIRTHFKLVRCQDSGKPVACEVLSYAGKPLYNLHKQCEFIYSILLREGLNELDCGVEVNRSFNRPVAAMLEAGTVVIDVDATRLPSAAHVLGRIENLALSPERRARVVVDQRSGTIVIGEDVRISRVAISQGSLTVRVDETPVAVQPNPFTEGETIVLPRTDIEMETEPGIGLAEVVGDVSLSQLVTGLNALGVGPRDMIDVLKSIHAAGALHAEFIIQ